jgi:hypothetical protein
MVLQHRPGRRRARRQRRENRFAYADQISLALEQSAQAARTIVRDTGDGA